MGFRGMEGPKTPFCVALDCGFYNCLDRYRLNRDNILARSAKLPSGLYILLAVISFFFIFFNDLLETNYLRIHWTDFRSLCTKW